MKIATTTFVALAAVLITALAGALLIAQVQQPSKDVQRGEYLVKGTGCEDCHTPMKMGPSGPELDNARMLSGHPEALVMPPVPKLPDGPWLMVISATMTAWAGPWGVSFTANLTPDRETGLGTWTSQTFIDAIRSGRHMGRGR
jgi:mono/diheme cytochrome c family protein